MRYDGAKLRDIGAEFGVGKERARSMVAIGQRTISRMFGHFEDDIADVIRRLSSSSSAQHSGETT